MYFTKPIHNTLGFLDVDVYIYDENGTCLLKIRDEDEKAEASIYAGLAKGTYYVMLSPQYGSYAHGKNSNYKFIFKESANCELEPNNIKENATPMKVDISYTGYLGSAFGMISDYKDNEDIYAVKLTKGQAYKFTWSENTTSNNTTIIKLLGKNTDMGSLWPSVESKDFCVEPGTTFIAPYTGTYYARIYNYSNVQYKYTVKITNVTPKATSFTSVKAGSKAFTAKWKKVTCSGYQIQYSTSKTFKSAKTVKVSSSKLSTTVKKLSSKKKYYVRIRTYKKVGNKYAYSAWSNAKTVTTK